MNIFSNIGITELIVILLLALLVVGPERLPELARQLGKTLRDVRRAYENLTRDLGPELTSIQKSTQELRESVESVRTIPDDLVKSIVKAADLDETVDEVKGVTGSIGQISQTLSETKKVIQHPVNSAVGAARNTLSPPSPFKQPEVKEEAQTDEGKAEKGEQEEKTETAASTATEQANE
jgi:sec-independent protein translocase protein TatB